MPPPITIKPNLTNPQKHTPHYTNLQLDSGEYFLSERERKSRAISEKYAKSAQKSYDKKQEREKDFVAPTAADTSGSNGGGAASSSSKKDIDLEKLKGKFSAAGKKRSRNESSEGLDEFVATKPSKKK